MKEKEETKPKKGNAGRDLACPVTGLGFSRSFSVVL
jgi:hypothetical protein